MPPRPAFWLLVLVTISGTMALHMLLPALPAVAAGLGVQPGEAQLAISVYIGGLALGQLVYGPLSDALGRRPLLLCGLLLYVAGGVASACAMNLPMLLAARLVQALGGCAGIALGRAMVRDSSTPETALGQLALLNLAIILGPAFAPMAGGAVAADLGWRAVFALLAVLGALTLFLAWRKIPETRQPSGRVALRARLADAGELLRSRRFLGFAMGGGVVTTSTYGFLAAAPFILTRELHQTVEAAGFYAGIVLLGAGAGSALTTALAERVRAERLLFTGAGVATVAAAMLLMLVATGTLDVPLLLASMLVFTCGVGITNPVALAFALGVRPQLAGSAAGLYGCIQMAMGALVTALAGLGSTPSLSASCVMLVAVIAGQVFFAAGLRAKAP
jgi:DHA1 family bicyclomycin/chloramphenicol resistance-like MFS transporter